MPEISVTSPSGKSSAPVASAETATTRVATRQNARRGVLGEQQPGAAGGGDQQIAQGPAVPPRRRWSRPRPRRWPSAGRTGSVAASAAKTRKRPLLVIWERNAGPPAPPPPPPGRARRRWSRSSRRCRSGPVRPPAPPAARACASGGRSWPARSGTAQRPQRPTGPPCPSRRASRPGRPLLSPRHRSPPRSARRRRPPARRARCRSPVPAPRRCTSAALSRRRGSVGRPGPGSSPVTRSSATARSVTPCSFSTRTRVGRVGGGRRPAVPPARRPRDRRPGPG